MSSDYDYVLWLISIQTNLYKYGGTILMGVGTISCILCLIVFTKKELRKNPCSVYLTAYNTSNLFMIYTAVLMATLANGFAIDPSVYNLSFCRFRYYVMFLFDILSPSYLILASVDRILITSRNARTRQRSTLRFAFICISIVSLFWILIHVHALVLPSFQTVPPGVTICYFQPGLHLIIIGYYILIIKGILVPLLMIILGIWTVRNVQSLTHVTPVSVASTTRTVATRNVRQGHSKDRQLLQILLMDIIIYVIFNIMIAVVFLYNQFNEEQGTTYVGTVFQIFLVNVGIFSIYIPYCISCYTNLLASKTFRHEMKNVLMCK